MKLLSTLILPLILLTACGGENYKEANVITAVQTLHTEVRSHSLSEMTIVSWADDGRATVNYALDEVRVRDDGSFEFRDADSTDFFPGKTWISPGFEGSAQSIAVLNVTSMSKPIIFKIRAFLSYEDEATREITIGVEDVSGPYCIRD